jgi:tRNA (mo5U34)-methyltransferase
MGEGKVKMNPHYILEQAELFGPKLADVKAQQVAFKWYPYSSMTNLGVLASCFKGRGLEIFDMLGGNATMLDIGAADGDTSFFCDSLGCDVTIIDNASTNFNRCLGIRYLQDHLSPRVKLIERDLDFTTDPFPAADFAFFLGILYHLRNPMMALIALAESVEFMVVSTPVFSRLQVDGENIEDWQCAALTPCRFFNDDPTNYWWFTPANLRTVLSRSGWRVLDEFRIGDLGNVIGKTDQRMYCFCRRVENWRHLRLHHDF